MLLLFALTTLSGTFAFRWTSSSTFPNGTILKNCIGDNVTLPWTFTTNSTDGIFIEWIKLSDGQDKSILASYNQDTLFKSKSKRWLEFVPNAGLLLPDVTLSDTGNYSVQIRIRNEAQIYQQSAFVRVSNQLSKTPVTTDDGLHAFILPESSFQLSTRQWHAQLGCGKFLSRDKPSVSVMWKTPSDRTINSTSYKKHVSILTLPNPAEEGDYSCFLDRAAIAEQCLQSHFNLSRLSDTAATVNIKETDIRLLLIEGNVEALWKQNGDPTNGLFHLANIVQQLQLNYNQSAKDVKQLQLQLESNYNQSAEDVKELQLQVQSNYNQSAKDVKELQLQVQSNYNQSAKDVKELQLQVQSNYNQSTKDVKELQLQVQSNYNQSIKDVKQLQSNYNQSAKDVKELQSNYNQSAKDVKELQLQVQSNYNQSAKDVKQLQSNYNQSAKDVKELQLQLQSNYNQSAKEAKYLRQQVENTTESVQELKIRNEKLSSALQELQSKYDALATVVLYDQFGLSRIPSKDDLEKRPTSCDDVKKYDKASGIHTLFLLYNKTINVFCDQTTDNGGWLVIQRRQDGSVDFDRDWEEYELGFGNLKTEFWIGLGSLYRLTRSKNFRLRVDLTEFGGTTTYAVYNTFSIGGVPDNYRLRVDGYSGTAGNDLSLHNDMQFSTPERDHDTFKTGNCARMFTGGWWFGFCVDVNLNGRYNASRVFWKDRLLKHVEMKIKL